MAPAPCTAREQCLLLLSAAQPQCLLSLSFGFGIWHKPSNFSGYAQLTELTGDILQAWCCQQLRWG